MDKMGIDEMVSILGFLSSKDIMLSGGKEDNCIVYYPYGVIPYFMVHYCLPACDLWTTRNSSDAVRRVPHDNDRPYLQPVRNLF